MQSVSQGKPNIWGLLLHQQDRIGQFSWKGPTTSLSPTASTLYQKSKGRDKENNQRLIFFLVFNQYSQTLVHGEVPCLLQAHTALPALPTDTAPYQHVSFFPIPARTLRRKEDIIFAFKRQKRLTRIGPPRYRGFCKSRNNVAVQDLALCTQAPPGTPTPLSAASLGTRCCPGVEGAR